MRRKTGAILCPSCRKLISVDEKRCPYCGALRPGLWGFGPALQQLLGRDPDLVHGIIVARIVMYIVSLAVDLPGAMQFRCPLSLLSPSGKALYVLGMTGRVASLPQHWWTVLTAIYLHGGILHILLNMMSLRQLGPDAQDAFGPARFLVL